MGDTIITVLLGLLIAAGVLAVVYIALVLKKAIVVLGSVDEALRESATTISALRESIVPVIAEAEDTVRSVNTEMARIDGVVGNLVDVSDKIAVTAEKVNAIVNKPLDAVNSAALRFRRIRRERAAERDALPHALPHQK